jgi:hypothetical protein
MKGMQGTGRKKQEFYRDEGDGGDGKKKTRILQG